MAMTLQDFVGIPFHNIFVRMTAAELRTACSNKGLLTGAAPATIPSYLMAYGALTHLECYFTSAATGTLPASSAMTTEATFAGSRRRFASGALTNSRRGYQVYDLLEQQYQADPVAFFTAIGVSDTRARELIDFNPKTTDDGPRFTQVPMWSFGPVPSTAAFNTKRLIPSVTTVYAGGTPPSATTVANAIDAAAHSIVSYEFKTSLVLGGGPGSFLLQATNVSGQWLYGFYDGDFQLLANGSRQPPGIWTDTWQTQKIDSPSSDWKTFWDALPAALAAKGLTLDYLTLDLEAVQAQFNVWAWEKSGDYGGGPNTGGFGNKKQIASFTDDGTGHLRVTTVADGANAIELKGYPNQMLTFENVSDASCPEHLNGDQTVAAWLHPDPDLHNLDVPGVTVCGGRSTTSTSALYGDNAPMQDSRWGTVTGTYLACFSGTTDWAHADDVSGTASWANNVVGDERTSVWNAFAKTRYVAALEQLAEYVWTNFPDCQVHLYEGGLYAASLYNAGLANGQLAPYGVAASLGKSGASPGTAEYGISSRNFYLGPQATSTPLENWSWRTLSRNAGAGTAYDYLTFDINLHRGTAAASNRPRVNWLAYKQLATPVVRSSTMYEELVLHLLLDGNQPHWYLDPNTTAADADLFVALLEEFDDAVEGNAIIPDVGAPLDWNPPYIASSADVGGRRVYRVTPNPALATTALEVGGGVLFNFAGQDSLFIPTAAIHRPTTEYAPSGYWVRQTLAGFPDMLGILYGFSLQAVP